MLPLIKTEPDDDDHDTDYEYLVPNESLQKSKRDLKHHVDPIQTLMRRERDKLRQRSRRAVETEEEKNRRRERAKFRARIRRAFESDDERALRRRTARERRRLERATETEEEGAKRREYARARIRLHRAMESEDVKAKRRLRAREHIKLKRALELDEEKQRKREIARERARKSRARETEEQKRIRNERGRERMKRKRAMEILKTYGYTDHQLTYLVNQYVDEFGEEIDGNEIDYIKIKEYLLKKIGNTERKLPISDPLTGNKFNEDPTNFLHILNSQTSTDSKPLDNRLPNVTQTKRISDLTHLFEQLQQISEHNNHPQCNFNSISFVSEKLNGLSSVLNLRCNNCHATFITSLIPAEEELNVNTSAVEIAESTGIGHIGLNMLLSGIGMLPITEIKYAQLQSTLKDTKAPDPLSVEDGLDIKEEDVQFQHRNDCETIDILPVEPCLDIKDEYVN